MNGNYAWGFNPDIWKDKIIVYDRHVSDYQSIRRSFKERFFSLPWRPWKSHKIIHSPCAYIADNYIFVSPSTFRSITPFIDE